MIGDGVFGGVAILLFISRTFAGLRGCNGDHAAITSGSRMDVMSERELRRCFFFCKGVMLVGVPSPMLLSVEVVRCALPGRGLGSSCVIEPEVVGLSRDTGLDGGSIRLSVSVDLDLAKEALERLGGWEWPSPGLLAFLLRVRHIDATFDSDSFLLFSRLKLPSPNLLFRDDAFELRDPVLIDRVLVKEPVADLVLPSWSSCREGSCVVSAFVSIELFVLITVKQAVIIIYQTVKKRDVIMGIAVKYQSFSKAGNESTAISIVSRGVKETLIKVSTRKETPSGYSIL